MSLPPTVRAAYERGRLRDAARAALPVLVLPIAGIVLAHFAAGAVCVGAALLVAFLAARWRGQSWSKGAVVGVVAGALAAVVPACLAVQGGGCAGPACEGWCAQVCGSTGMIAGILVGRQARDLQALSAGAGIAAAAVALGCWPMGGATVVGAAGALVVGAVGGRLLGRATG